MTNSILSQNYELKFFLLLAVLGCVTIAREKLSMINWPYKLRRSRLFQDSGYKFETEIQRHIGQYLHFIYGFTVLKAKIKKNHLFSVNGLDIIRSP